MSKLRQLAEKELANAEKLAQELATLDKHEKKDSGEAARAKRRAWLTAHIRGHMESHDYFMAEYLKAKEKEKEKLKESKGGPVPRKGADEDEDARLRRGIRNKYNLN